MTFYELKNNLTIQGNIRLSVWDYGTSECEEVAYYDFIGSADLQWEDSCDGRDKIADKTIEEVDLDDFDDYEVTYIYSMMINGREFLVIEICTEGED